MTEPSHRVQDVRPTTIRLDDETRAAVDRRAKQHGVSTADYIRQALTSRLAWDRALETAKAGGDLDQLADPALFAAMLNEYAREHGG